MLASSTREEVGLQISCILIDFMMSADVTKFQTKCPMVSVKKFSEHEGILYQQAFIECPLYENNNACIHNLQVISTNYIYDTQFSLSLFPFLM